MHWRTAALAFVGLLVWSTTARAQITKCGPGAQTTIDVVYVVLTYSPGEPRLDGSFLSAVFSGQAATLTPKTENEWFIELSTVSPALPKPLRFDELQKIFDVHRSGWHFTRSSVEVVNVKGRCAARFAYLRNLLWQVTVQANPDDISVPVSCGGTPPACGPNSPTRFTTNSVPVRDTIRLTIKFADTRCWYDRPVTYDDLVGDRRELKISKREITTALLQQWPDECDPRPRLGLLPPKLVLPADGMLIQLAPGAR
jgi:hypothetical protein